jgi:hypothetical protein
MLTPAIVPCDSRIVRTTTSYGKCFFARKIPTSLTSEIGQPHPVSKISFFVALYCLGDSAFFSSHSRAYDMTSLLIRHADHPFS